DVRLPGVVPGWATGPARPVGRRQALVALATQLWLELGGAHPRRGGRPGPVVSLVGHGQRPAAPASLLAPGAAAGVSPNRLKAAKPCTWAPKTRNFKKHGRGGGSVAVDLDDLIPSAETVGEQPKDHVSPGRLGPLLL